MRAIILCIATAVYFCGIIDAHSQSCAELQQEKQLLLNQWEAARQNFEVNPYGGALSNWQAMMARLQQLDAAIANCHSDALQHGTSGCGNGQSCPHGTVCWTAPADVAGIRRGEVKCVTEDQASNYERMIAVERDAERRKQEHSLLSPEPVDKRKGDMDSGSWSKEQTKIPNAISKDIYLLSPKPVDGGSSTPSKEAARPVTTPPLARVVGVPPDLAVHNHAAALAKWLKENGAEIKGALPERHQKGLEYLKADQQAKAAIENLVKLAST